MPKVATIVSYDRAPFVERTVRSLFDQTHRDVEVIVLDLGTDDTAARVHATFGPQVAVVSCPGAPIGRARNVALAGTDAPFVALTSSDSPCDPRRLERQLAALGQRPEAGMCHGAVRWVDEQYRPMDLPPDRSLLSHLPREGDLARTLLLEGNPILGVTVMLRRDVLDRVGGFFEDPEESADLDLWLRMACAAPVVWVPEPLVDYRAWTFAIPADAPARSDRQLRTLRRHARTTAPRLGVEPWRMARRLRDVQVDLAAQHLAAGAPELARRAALGALLTAPPSAQALAILAASVLPRPGVELLRAAKRRLGLRFAPRR